MYKIAVCDDHKEFVDLISNKVQQYCDERRISIIIQCFYDGDLLAELTEKKWMFDAYILDIKMPSTSGIDLVKKIKEQTSLACIIFLTAFDTYAIKACGMGITGYVMKQQLDSELLPVLDKLFFQLSQVQKGRIYVINNLRKYVKLIQNDIAYIYKNQKNSIFVLYDGSEEKERLSLQEVYQKLDSPYMFILDRGIILNIRHIQKIIGNQVEMDNGHTMISSKKHIIALKRYLATYWETIV